MRECGGLAARLVFLALLGGGLLFWTHLRKPRTLRVELDLTSALPGEVGEVDVVVRRGEHVLARVEERYGSRGAPGTVGLELVAAPGAAEVEATLVRAAAPASRLRSSVELSEGRPARVVVAR